MVLRPIALPMLLPLLQRGCTEIQPCLCCSPPALCMVWPLSLLQRSTGGKEVTLEEVEMMLKLLAWMLWLAV